MRKKALHVLIALGASTFPGLAQQVSSSAGVPANLVVTVEPRKGADNPVVEREDVMVYQGRDRRKVTDWIPLQGDHAGMQFYVLIDDGSSTSLGSQLDDLRKFIQGLRETTQVAVGYMRNGTVETVQNLTADHAAAAKSLRLPLGSPGASSSPYFALEDLIKRWPESKMRREVLMITDGVDRFGGSGPANPYINSTIQKTLRAGIIVYAIYFPGAGHEGHSYWRLNWGQNYLSQLADETGGEAYYLGLQAPVSFGPYLEDLANKLTRQYLLTFLSKQDKKPGFQRVTLRTEAPNVELVSADQVFVPAAQ